MTDKTDGTLEAKTAAGVTFTSTGDGSLDESAIPTEGFESHYLFPGDNKSTSTYPVVDAEDVLRKENVRSAQSLGARGGVSDDALESKIETLAQEFEPPLNLGGEDDEEDDDGEASLVEGRIAAGDLDRDDSTLRGVVWAAGTHSLFLNGEPTTVHVPEATIEPTFERLNSRIAIDSVSIGFDHPDSGSVAATTPVGELGLVKDAELDESGEKIVMTDSVVTNNKARSALEAGDFDGYDYSIVGSFGVSASGSAPGDAEASLSSVDIHRVDVVPDGAVNDAQVNRNVPPVAAALADLDPNRPASEFAGTLRAAAGSDVSFETMQMDFNTDVDDIEAARSALEQAADVVEEKEEQRSALEAENEELAEFKRAFEEIASAFDLDPSLEDDGLEEVTAAAVDVVTEDLRQEVAEIEASLPSVDLADDEIEERVEDLKGRPADELEARAGNLARELRETVGVSDGTHPVSRDEMAGSASSGSTEQLADGVLDMFEAREAKETNRSPAQFIRDEYDLDPDEYGSEHRLQSAMADVRKNGGVN